MSRSQHPHPRAYLRHQCRRILAQRLRVIRNRFSFGDEPWDRFLEQHLKYALRSAETPCACPDYCCANRRNAFGVQSRHEVLSVIALREELLPLGLANLDRQGLTPNWLKLRRELHHVWLAFCAETEEPPSTPEMMDD
jgi:hypothetical protein